MNSGLTVGAALRVLIINRSFTFLARTRIRRVAHWLAQNAEVTANYPWVLLSTSETCSSYSTTQQISHMHYKLTCCSIALLVFVPTVIAQNPVRAGDNKQLSTQANEKFSAALESQLACRNAPEPAKAVGALQQTGMVERRSYLNIDSLNYFRARQPLTVWGFKVISVFGFDFYPRIFERGPGTAPPITLGVVVSASVTTVQSTLKRLGLENTNVQPAAELELNAKRAKSIVLTDIYCEER